MTRSELEHLIRAAGAIADDDQIIDFTRELVRQGYTQKATLLERLATVKATASLTRLVQGRIGRDFAR